MSMFGAVKPPATAKRPVALTAATFETFDWSRTPYAVVACEAEWCGNCERLKPAFAEAAALMAQASGDVAFAELTLSYTPPRKDPTPDATEHFSSKYGIDAYPIILGFYEGRLIGKYEGDRSKESLFKFGLSLKSLAVAHHFV